MITALFILISDKKIKPLLFSVLSLYIFIGVSYINQLKKNGANDDKITKQIIGIVLGTILLMIIISSLCKIIILIQTNINLP